MSISIDQWRASIGLFCDQVYGHIKIKLSVDCCDLKVFIIMSCCVFLQVLFFYFSWNMGMLKSILDPKKEARLFYCFHWNSNCILAHNKLSLLDTYNTIHKYDNFCISETYLDSSVSVNETIVSLPGFNLVRSDHSNNVTRSGFTKIIYLWDQFMYHSFLSVCYVKWPVKVKKIIWLLSIDHQVNQQLNLINSYQILKIYLILLKNLNHPLLWYWAILMQDLNHSGQMT